MQLATSGVPMANPYLDAYRELVPEGVDPPPEIEKDTRLDLVWRHSWSIPTASAVGLLAGLSPIVEIGAGTGYWASLIRAAGGDVVAFDAAPPGLGMDNGWHIGTCWTDVVPGSIEVLPEYADRTLMLCWPPFSEQYKPEGFAERKEHLATCMAYKALRSWRGQRVVYIGEWRCCTAGWAFHDLLERHWREVGFLVLPSWPGYTDRLRIYERIPRKVPTVAGQDATPTPAPMP